MNLNPSIDLKNISLYDGDFMFFISTYIYIKCTSTNFSLSLTIYYIEHKILQRANSLSKDCNLHTWNNVNTF